MISKRKVWLVTAMFFVAGAVGQRIFVIGLIAGFILALIVTAAIAEAIYSKSKAKGESAISAVIWAASYLVGGGLSEAASGTLTLP